MNVFVHYKISLFEIIDKFKVENELKQLYLSKSRYDNSRIECENKLNYELPRQLKYQEQYLDGLKKDINNVEDLSSDNFKIVINNVTLTSRRDASTSLYNCYSLLKFGEEKKIGEISGFDIVGTRDGMRFHPLIFIKGTGKYKVEVSHIDEIGNIYKLENILKSFENKIDLAKQQIEYTKKQMEDVKLELEKEFVGQERIKELQKEKARIDSELDLDKQDNSNVIENNDDNEKEK